LCRKGGIGKIGRARDALLGLALLLGPAALLALVVVAAGLSAIPAQKQRRDASVIFASGAPD
jgi:hypothetical protein